ncbi:WYL domain-containing transcriptional regulator [Nitrincola tapanii]|uniref:WYL domain-containing protein n=1 Tax=Nitrincola tapanii TaxID=1708751 RepID=A0A5A9WAJ1_9GAMM|nr:WYL domain-containing protein [Nitrincola tapanii]KAA0876451.1 WYL domain-containing protein [Nitrincola tapanii]
MPENSQSILQSQPYAQRERLAYIDFSLQYHGSVSRIELMRHFDIAVASGTRDFALYRELAPDNLILRLDNKRYYRTDRFQPLFQHDTHAVLNTLAHGFGDKLSLTPSGSGFCEEAPALMTPPQATLAILTRAISQGLVVEMTYLSLASGHKRRQVVPHSLVNNGRRWHLRGYCRSRGEFRDFVCTRITQLDAVEKPVAVSERQGADAEWNQYITLDLVPHPGHQHPEAIALDFSMSEEDGQPLLRLNTRAARAGYLLQHWQVDASPDHHLPPNQYHLWLRNSDTLCRNAAYPLTNLRLAPGFMMSDTDFSVSQSDSDMTRYK